MLLYYLCICLLFIHFISFVSSFLKWVLSQREYTSFIIKTAADSEMLFGPWVPFSFNFNRKNGFYSWFKLKFSSILMEFWTRGEKWSDLIALSILNSSLDVSRLAEKLCKWRKRTSTTSRQSLYTVYIYKYINIF
jgi:hypothetical protein